MKENKYFTCLTKMVLGQLRPINCGQSTAAHQLRPINCGPHQLRPTFIAAHINCSRSIAANISYGPRQLRPDQLRPENCDYTKLSHNFEIILTYLKLNFIINDIPILISLIITIFIDHISSISCYSTATGNFNFYPYAR
jgi:hypothetical protein